MDIENVELDAKSLEFSQSIEVKMVDSPELEINSKYHVERIPMPSSNFYFTHDFWLSPHKLIFQTPIEIRKSKIVTLSERCLLFTAEFKENSSDCIITPILPPSVNCYNAVLSYNKKFLVVAYENEIVILNTKDWSVLKRLPLNIPELYNFGQLSLTNDDAYLMHEVNLDWDKPNAYKETKYSTWINLMNLETGKIISFAHKPYPSMWSHILCNPQNSREITSALVTYSGPFPMTAEYNQRLWITDITDIDDSSNVSDISDNSRTQNISDMGNSQRLIPKPLYNQRKKSFFHPAERITHECWCKNGKYLTFIVRRKKLKRVFIENNESEIIMNDGPNPWHCDGSVEDWVVFDTMNKDSGIWLGKTDRSLLINLCKQNTLINGQMHHPHPFFSPDMKYIYFNADIGNNAYVHRVKTNIL